MPMTHSKGPWEADQGGIWDADGKDVATCGELAQWSGDCFHPFDNANANARLIASAPCLLEALEAMERNTVNLYRGIVPGGNYGANAEGSNLNESAFADNDEIVKAARAVIDRARGKSA